MLKHFTLDNDNACEESVCLLETSYLLIKLESELGLLKEQMMILNHFIWKFVFDFLKKKSKTNFQIFVSGFFFSYPETFVVLEIRAMEAGHPNL